MRKRFTQPRNPLRPSSRRRSSPSRISTPSSTAYDISEPFLLLNMPAHQNDDDDYEPAPAAAASSSNPPPKSSSSPRKKRVLSTGSSEDEEEEQTTVRLTPPCCQHHSPRWRCNERADQSRIRSFLFVPLHAISRPLLRPRRNSSLSSPAKSTRTRTT
jgi:hypothetical protein